jgi:hypothetical protein
MIRFNEPDPAGSPCHKSCRSQEKTCYAAAPKTKKEKDGRTIPKRAIGSHRNGWLDDPEIRTRPC